MLNVKFGVKLEVKFDEETLENQDVIAAVEEKSTKRNSLSKFFTFKGFKNAEGSMDGEQEAQKTNSLIRLFTKKDAEVDAEAGAPDGEAKVPKTNTLSRLFSKKDAEVATADGEAKVPKINSSKTLSRLFTKKNVTDPKISIGSEVSPRRSVIMRGLMNCHVPWISRKPSKTNLHNPISVHIPDGDDEAQPEIAKASEIF